jgi:methionine synthase I (cobalamin-dependent)
MLSFHDRLATGEPLLYDGGFGSELFSRGVELINSSLANDSHPDAVIDTTCDYIDAGAELVQTNTFVASPLHLAMAGVEGDGVERLVNLAVDHAKAARDRTGRDVYIAGSLGPSPGAIEADSGDTVFGIENEKARRAHERVATALAEGGVDLLLLETMFSAKEAAIAVDVARKFGLPIAVSMTYKFTKNRKTDEIIYRTDWGHSAADLLDILVSGEFSGGDNLLDDVLLLGLNCGAEQERVEHTGMLYAQIGTTQMRSALESRGITGKYLVAYPNAGMPRLDKQQRTVYDQSPEEMASHVDGLVAAGAAVIGGCCGTRPDHIRAIGDAVRARSRVG